MTRGTGFFFHIAKKCTDSREKKSKKGLDSVFFVEINYVTVKRGKTIYVTAERVKKIRNAVNKICFLVRKKENYVTAKQKNI